MRTNLHISENVLINIEKFVRKVEQCENYIFSVRIKIFDLLLFIEMESFWNFVV